MEENIINFIGLLFMLFLLCIVIRPCLKTKPNKKAKRCYRYDIHYEYKHNNKTYKGIKTVYKTPKFHFDKLQI